MVKKNIITRDNKNNKNRKEERITFVLCNLCVEIFSDLPHLSDVINSLSPYFLRLRVVDVR